MKLMNDGIGGQGLSIRMFAERHGIKLGTMQRYCREGKIFGARKHPLTKSWWIYPPAKLLCVPRQKNVNTSHPMNSTLHAEKRV